MNLMKWLECWWWKRHVPVIFRPVDAPEHWACVRCGIDVIYKVR